MTLPEAAALLERATGLIATYEHGHTSRIHLLTQDLSVAGPITLLVLPVRIVDGCWTVLWSLRDPVRYEVRDTFNALLADGE